MENKIFSLTLPYIDCFCFPYVKVGTIAFAKFEDGTIRKAKCVKNDFVQCYPNSEPNHGKLVQCWKVAGLQGLFWGYPDGKLYRSNYQGKVANLYVNEDNAQFATCHADKGDDVGNCECNLYQLAEKYGVKCEENIMRYWGYPTIYMRLWAINDFGETCRAEADFYLEYNSQDEFELVIPSIDEKRLFATEEDARANFKRKPVIDFDDEEEETTNPQEEFVEVTVKVKKSDVKRVKEFVNDCIEFE